MGGWRFMEVRGDVTNVSHKQQTNEQQWKIQLILSQWNLEGWNEEFRVE